MKPLSGFRGKPAPPPLEKVEQQATRDIMRRLGAREYVLGTGQTARVRQKRDGRTELFYSTQQTPGIPDLQFFLPETRPAMLAAGRTRRFLVVESKRKQKSKYYAEQKDYRELCAASGTEYVGGSYDDVLAWLLRENYLTPDQLPHYRLPKELKAVDDDDDA